MNPIKRFVQAWQEAKMGANYIGAPSFAIQNPYNFNNNYKSDSYATVYPSIRAISNEYMTIRPYAIDSNGKTVNHPAVDALYHPNQADSSVAFFEKIAVSTLSKPLTYVLVWRREGGEARPGGDFGFQGRTIAGYTFLENPSISMRDGRIIYSIGAQEFTDKEVIVLPGGVDPHNLYAGYSPSKAAKKWATLDAYIADFQKGFFENNAIPAGHFIITAASQKDYEDTVEQMKKKHQGAGKNNNVLYTPRPIDPKTDKPADSKVEWIPFGQSNREIDFRNLFDQTNQRTERAFGVSQFIQGVDDAPNYATAQVSEKNFGKRAVYPLALRNYTQITHELNRITGGLGIAITFDYEIPTVADEEKVEAETKTIEANLITTLTTAGYSLNSIVDAFELSNGYKLLSMEQTPAVIDNDKPDVDEGDEVDDSPDPEKIDGVTPLNKGEAKRTNPKAQISDEDKIANVTREYLKEQIETAIEGYREDPVVPQDRVKMQSEPTQEEQDQFVEDMLLIATAILISYGIVAYEAEAIAAGLVLAELQGFTFSETAQDTYQAHIRQVATSFGNDTSEAIKKVITDGQEAGLSRAEIERNLRNLVDTDEWRVKRVAVTELNNAENIGRLEGVISLEAETGRTFEKTLAHPQGTVDPLCLSQEGVWFPTSQPIWDYGQPIVTNNDKGETLVYINNYETNRGHGLHPHCTGFLQFREVTA